MKIAVPTNDGIGISPHFGHSGGFIFFEVESGRITASRVQQNSFASHEHGDCGGPHEGPDSAHSEADCQGHAHEQSAHSHADILAALRECELVLCRGIGGRAVQDLQAGGIRAVPTPFEGTAEQAVQAFLEGSLPTGGNFCGCHN